LIGRYQRILSIPIFSKRKLKRTHNQL
jgi:putative sugar O-methyltransferase